MTTPKKAKYLHLINYKIVKRIFSNVTQQIASGEIRLTSSNSLKTHSELKEMEETLLTEVMKDKAVFKPILKEKNNEVYITSFQTLKNK